MENLTIFENEEFGRIRVVEKDGEPWFVGKDVADVLGYKNPQEAIRTHVEDEEKGVSEILTPGGIQKMPVINESGLYSLILSSKLPAAKRFKHWVTSEVLPSIRKTGSYQMQTMSQAEIVLWNAQRLVEQERRMKEIEDRQSATEVKLKDINARLEKHPTGWYTIAGYASTIGMSLDIRTAGELGRKASRLSRKLGKKIESTPDPRFGRVNVYAPEVLEKVFEEMD